MRSAKLSCIEFYSCYLQQYLTIDLLSYRTPIHGQKGHMNIVCASFIWKFSWNWLFSFFLELNMVLGAHVVLCMTARFFGDNVLPPKWGK